jgi:plastocyanin
MPHRLFVSGLLLLLVAGVLQLGAEIVRAANVGVTASGGAFQDGDGDENTTIAAGDTVTWTFADGQPHTVTSDAGAFDSGAEQVGGTYAFTFNTPGSFGYYCKVHGLPGQGMHGTVTVQAAATNTASAATNTPDATNTRTPTRTFTSTPPATGTVTVAPTTVASTPTPFEAVPINATEPAPPRGGAGQSVIAPAVGSGDGGSGDGFRTETLMIALIVVGALMIAGAGVARLRG